MTTPRFPFSKPERNLAVTAQTKFWLNPKSSSVRMVKTSPVSMIGLRPNMSADHPHAKLPMKFPTKKALPRYPAFCPEDNTKPLAGACKHSYKPKRGQ